MATTPATKTASTSDPSTNKGANTTGQNKKTASTSETGHAKNVANFENLISFCTGFGSPYNPSNPNLQIPQLNTQLASTKANLLSVTNASVAFNNAVNQRMAEFEGLKSLSTQIVNALDATSASSQTVKNARSINQKIQGPKSKKNKNTAVRLSQPTDPVTATSTNISTSQQSYSNLIEHFVNLVTIVSTEPAYLPNETELQVTTLNALATTLQNTNTAVINSYTTISNARISRNQSLYNPTNGLCQIAQEVKMYVKSVFKASSPQYKQISGIEFKLRK